MSQSDIPLGEFRFSTGKSPLRLTGWTLLILAPVVLFLFAARGNLAAVTGNQIAISIMMLMLIVGVLLNFLFTRIDVYSHALVQKRFFSKHTIPFDPYMQLYISRWRYGLLVLTFGRCTTLTIDSNGIHYIIPPSFRQNEKIAETIENYLFKESMHMLNQIYDANEVLHFGAIQLSRNHISIGSEQLLRQNLGRLSINNGKLKIYAKNKKGEIKRLALTSVRLDKIANFRLLCRFVELNEFATHQQFYRIKRILFW